jgi:KipI family sensor histidine kinase inhibitor
VGEAGEERRVIVRAAGDRAVLIELDPEIDAGLLHAAALSVRSLPAVLRCTPGRSSLFVVSREPIEAGDLRDAIARARLMDSTGAEHRIEVSFAERHSLDLELLLRHASLSRDAFLARIAELTFTARHLGFRPGFAYLDGVPEEWRLPRRPTPRDLVPRGSFAFAGPAAAFYPDDSPGGWNLLGRTTAVLWDPARDVPNLIAPGDRVRIVPVS